MSSVQDESDILSSKTRAEIELGLLISPNDKKSSRFRPFLQK